MPTGSSTFRVEQVFLIHRDTGLLLQHAFAAAIPVEDADGVSGMLTALRTFVQGSFATTEHDGLDSLKVGDLQVLIEQGPHAFIAGVVRGQPGPALRKALQETLEEIHITFGEELQEYSGDSSPFESVRTLLERCLMTQ